METTTTTETAIKTTYKHLTHTHRPIDRHQYFRRASAGKQEIEREKERVRAKKADESNFRRCRSCRLQAAAVNGTANIFTYTKLLYTHKYT